MTEITTVNEALLIADLTESETRYRLRFGREMFWRGYRQAEDDMAVRWKRIAAPVASNRPGLAELERRRWGPAGREHFGDPRPGDFPGRGSAAA